MSTAKGIVVLMMGATLPACIVDDDDEGTLEVVNESAFVIEELRVADIDDPFFGRDLTGGDALFPDEALSVRLDCDIYDVFFVDEFGVECTVLGVDVCLGRTTFFIDDILLEDCAFARIDQSTPQEPRREDAGTFGTAD